MTTSVQGGEPNIITLNMHYATLAPLDGPPPVAKRLGPQGFRAMRIELDDLRRAEVLALLSEHLTSMYSLSPPESVHALNIEGLRSPDVTFWTVWEDNVLLGCGALKELDRTHGEVKSMRTPMALRRRGAGRAVLTHILAEARARGYKRLSLETGSMEAFKPAQKLYESFGFVYCGPFAPYKEDPYSVFMTLELGAGVTVSVRGNAEDTAAARREPKP